jgi:hypothetical protein
MDLIAVRQLVAPDELTAVPNVHESEPSRERFEDAVRQATVVVRSTLVFELDLVSRSVVEVVPDDPLDEGVPFGRIPLVGNGVTVTIEFFAEQVRASSIAFGFEGRVTSEPQCYSRLRPRFPVRAR